MLSLVISKILLNAFTTNVIYKGPTIFKMFQYSWKKNLYNLFFKRAYIASSHSSEIWIYA